MGSTEDAVNVSVSRLTLREELLLLLLLFVFLLILIKHWSTLP